MRGPDTFTESLFSVKKLDDFVPASHPLRSIRVMVNEALEKLEDLFAGMYEDAAKGGRPSIAPQKLLRAMVLQVLYSVRSERLLMEQVQYNLLFRWFIGLPCRSAVGGGLLGAWAMGVMGRHCCGRASAPGSRQAHLEALRTIVRGQYL